VRGARGPFRGASEWALRSTRRELSRIVTFTLGGATGSHLREARLMRTDLSLPWGREGGTVVSEWPNRGREWSR
jgi:hypothetical protein